MTLDERIRLTRIALAALENVTAEEAIEDNDGDAALREAADKAWESLEETLEAIQDGEL